MEASLIVPHTAKMNAFIVELQFQKVTGAKKNHLHLAVLCSLNECFYLL